MKIYLTLIALCTITIGHTQIDLEFEGEQTSSDNDPTCLDIIYTTHFYQFGFIDQVNTMNDFQLGAPVQTIGLNEFIIPESSTNTALSTQISYSQIIPQNITLEGGRTGKLNGFNLSYQILGYNFLKRNRVVDLILGFGFNTGRKRIKSEGYRSIKNPFFAPALYFSPRFNMGRFSINLRAEYAYDVSKKGWRPLNFSNKEARFTAADFNQTALLVNFGLGWYIY